MTNTQKKDTGVWVWILGIIACILMIYSIDWSFLKGGVTEYPIYCPLDYNEGDGCYSHNPTTYYPNKHSQTVISQDEYGIETLRKCTVIDRKNWECKYDDESAVFGFNKGRFNKTTLISSIHKTMEEKIKDDLQYRYISRFMWLIQYWNLR